MSPEPAPTWPRCGDGTLFGTASGCPFYMAPVVPTPTPDAYTVVVEGEAGSTYLYSRSFGLPDVAVVGLLAALLLVVVVGFLAAQLRGR